MFVFMTLVPTMYEAVSIGYLNWTSLAIGAVIWSITGLVFGWSVNKFE
jgi:hypothetical protein